MPSMYDRLGDLLSETLEKGFIEKEGPSVEESTESSENSAKTEKQEEVRITRPAKPLTAEIRTAFEILGITLSASLEDAKSAYKQKLKMYHPDKFEGKQVMQQITSNKTRIIIQSYEIVKDYLS